MKQDNAGYSGASNITHLIKHHSTNSKIPGMAACGPPMCVHELGIFICIYLKHA
jgi:hypothetical protein